MALSCMNCAQVETSCCKKYQIPSQQATSNVYLIFLAIRFFFTLEPPALEDIEPGYDPLWRPMVIEFNGLACIINRPPIDKVFNQIQDILESILRSCVKAGGSFCRE